ncbi:SUMF1/EgtB/PvdO family nonheme iron enzyme [Marinobacterium rhizophilum]|uniref:SUMF1/EgtB/PvdO family nonheme iron enzyme n=1 Tax=Marinobacterium rhizophilum TaxID=420402 RepID=A0ABY5HKZ7_9GAMM|nr:SUMF1/EgtB/PvdO family nonheme iron enzyme [Marinobacterium rhizophilum]UTW11912.1 SUMF1/EgtB/PvdO family nonheme iron enzyme [Marinobacterium rhizophilum]
MGARQSQAGSETEAPLNRPELQLTPGQVLGPDHHRFQLGTRLDAHPLGELWQARDLSTRPETPVTLLLIAPELKANSAFANAFKKQMLLSKALQHPHVLASYGYFLDRSGQLFSAHEAVDGLTLAQLFARGKARKLAEAKQRALLAQLAQALDAGHQTLRQPHGALSPAQVFINRQGGVKLFGFASQEALQAAANPDDTAARYQAPETDVPSLLSIQSDMYSLGLICLQLLSGSLPPPADKDSPGLEHQPRPGKISPAQWRLLQQALATEPGNRPKGTAAWVQQLFRPPEQPAPPSKATAPAPSDTPDDGSAGQLSSHWQRFRGLLTPSRLAGGALFGAGLALGVWLGLWLSQPSVNPLQQQLQRLAEQNAELSTALQALKQATTADPLASQGPPPPLDADASAAPPPRFRGDRNTEGGFFLDALQRGDYGPQMVHLPRGSFLMGSDSRQSDDNEKPVQQISIDHAVALARHEVTFEDYDRFAQATGRPLPDDNGWGRGRQPVINVSWADASAYAQWLATETEQPYRLPSEAEWEYAARAGTRSLYWWGDELGTGFAVCDECGSEWDGKQPAPVGSLQANPWGLFDLNGNVDEWVQDCYADSHEGAPANGAARVQGGCKYRVMRGGSWFDIGRLVRSSSRYRNPPSSLRSSWGFRVAVDLPDPAP